MKTIIVEINPLGEVKIDAVGFKGEACAKATEAIEKALGVKTGSTKKPDYYQAATKATQKVGGA
jgi:hypothetical protein